MDASRQTKQEDEAFRAVLYPHRSLSPRGFLILMLAIGGVSFTAGAVFWWIGAWPVFGFFGLDVLLIYIAFKWNYYAARAFETVEVSTDQLRLTRYDAKGRHVHFDFNPYWVRVLLSERRGTQSRLVLASHGRELEFGRFLNNDERRQFASVLKDVLRANRQGYRPS